jgi:YVTN family beta-propeller protein
LFSTPKFIKEEHAMHTNARIVVVAATAGLALSLAARAHADVGQENGDPDVRVEVWSPGQIHDFGDIADVLAPRGVCADATVVSINEPPEGDMVAGAGFSPDGTELYVAYRDTKNILVYNPDTHAFLREIPLSGSPTDFRVSADGAWGVTANIIEDTASIIDLATGTEIAVVPVGDAPGSVRITPNSATAVVGSLLGTDLSVIDIATHTVTRTIPDFPFFQTTSFSFESFVVQIETTNPVELASDTLGIFADRENDQIVFVDLTNGAKTIIPASTDPTRVAITPDGTKAVVAHAGPTLTVLDVPTRSVSTILVAPENLRGPVSISPDGSLAAVSVLNATRFVDLATGAFEPALATASIYDLINTPDGQYALAVGFRGSLLDYTTRSLVTDLNNQVSTPIGAVSPVGHRAALFSTTFGDDMVIVNTDGPAGGVEFFGPSAPGGHEGDKPRTLALASDASAVYTANSFSDTVTKVDLATGSVVGYADIGQRSGEIEITPDGGTAVVANRDSDFLSLVDTTTLATTNVPIGRRGDQVEISPDGHTAYVAVIADGDGVWRVDLDNAVAIPPKLPAGQMAGIGFVGGQFSGMTLSHDGQTLVCCNSLDDTLTLIDVPTWSVAATVLLPIGDFPVRAVFSPDDSTIYPTNRTSDTVGVVSNDGASSTLLTSIPVANFPYLARISADGDRLYVLSTSPSTVTVLDLTTDSSVATIPFTEDAIDLVLDEANNRLLVTLSTVTASTGFGANGLTFNETGSVAIIDTATNTVTGSLCTSIGAAASAFAGNTVAVSSNLSDAVATVTLPGGCPCELDGVSGVDVFDLLAYLDLWFPQNAAADIDGTPGVDVFDLLTYLDCWFPASAGGSCA